MNRERLALASLLAFAGCDLLQSDEPTPAKHTIPHNCSDEADIILSATRQALDPMLLITKGGCDLAVARLAAAREGFAERLHCLSPRTKQDIEGRITMVANTLQGRGCLPPNPPSPQKLRGRDGGAQE